MFVGFAFFSSLVVVVLLLLLPLASVDQPRPLRSPARLLDPPCKGPEHAVLRALVSRQRRIGLGVARVLPDARVLELLVHCLVVARFVQVELESVADDASGLDGEGDLGEEGRKKKKAAMNAPVAQATEEWSTSLSEEAGAWPGVKTPEEIAPGRGRGRGRGGRQERERVSRKEKEYE